MQIISNTSFCECAKKGRARRGREKGRRGEGEEEGKLDTTHATKLSLKLGKFSPVGGTLKITSTIPELAVIN